HRDQNKAIRRQRKMGIRDSVYTRNLRRTFDERTPLHYGSPSFISGKNFPPEQFVGKGAL
ncbi:hypothetical protein N2S64_11995, partial [Escherichia coli]|nr:hypothetical protein [Escherichia coli]